MLTPTQAHNLLLEAIKNAPLSAGSLSFELEAVRQIQLDAFKAGAEWAAKRAEMFASTMEIKVHEELLVLTSERIKSLASNLKELPK